MWLQPHCYITEHSSVTLNHTMVQIIDIRTTRTLKNKTLFFILATFSKLKNIILSPWVSPSILHIFSRLSFFSLTSYFSRIYSIISNLFLHFIHRKKKYHKTRTSLTASLHNPRLLVFCHSCPHSVFPLY